MLQGDVRVVIADDHAIVREGLRALVEAQDGLTVIGEAGDGQEAWECTRELRPDVLLLDISMPGVGSAEVASRITQNCPDTRVLALTMHEERGYVSRMLRAGVAGYMLKRTPSDELVRAIRLVAAGGKYVDPNIAGSLVSASQETSPEDQQAQRELTIRELMMRELTPREFEILRLMARGHTNREIGSLLDINVKTVETHKSNGMAKLGLFSRAALVRFGIGQGWLRNE